MRSWLLASMIALFAGCGHEVGDGATGALGVPTAQCEVIGAGTLAGGDTLSGHVIGADTTTGTWAHDTGTEAVLGEASWISCRINGVVVADFGGLASIDGAAGYRYRVQVQDFGAASTSLVLGAPEVQTITATRRYRPSRWEDGAATIEERAVVAIPSELPVTVGNAGNMWAWITFERSAPFEDTVECRYRGGAHNPLPCTPEDLAAGASYHFEGCTSDIDGPLAMLPGEEVDVTSMTLHVHTGAHSLPTRHEAQTTVTLDLDVTPLVDGAPAGDMYRLWVFDAATGARVIFREGELATGDVTVVRR